MRKLMLCAMMVSLAAGSGCRKRSPSGETPRTYDPTVDAPASVLQAPYNPDLAKDQTQISRAVAEAAGAATPGSAPAGAPAAGAPATPDDLEAVKLVVAKMIEAGQQPDAQFYTPQDAPVVTALIQGMTALPAKQTEVENLLKTKLGMDQPSEALAKQMNPAPAGGEAGGPAPKAEFKSPLGSATIDQLKFEAVGPDVRVTGGGQPQVFTRTAQGWKVKFDPMERQMLGLMGDMVAAEGKFLDAVKAGVDDGSITKDNFDAKSKELADTHLKPAAEPPKPQAEF